MRGTNPAQRHRLESREFAGHDDERHRSISEESQGYSEEMRVFIGCMVAQVVWSMVCIVLRVVGFLTS